MNTTIIKVLTIVLTIILGLAIGKFLGSSKHKKIFKRAINEKQISQGLLSTLAACICLLNRGREINGIIKIVKDEKIDYDMKLDSLFNTEAH